MSLSQYLYNKNIWQSKSYTFKVSPYGQVEEAVSETKIGSRLCRLYWVSTSTLGYQHKLCITSVFFHSAYSHQDGGPMDRGDGISMSATVFTCLHGHTGFFSAKVSVARDIIDFRWNTPSSNRITEFRYYFRCNRSTKGVHQRLTAAPREGSWGLFYYLHCTLC